MIGGRPVDANGVELQGSLWSHIDNLLTNNASTDQALVDKLGEPEWTRIVYNDGTGNPVWSTYDSSTGHGGVSGQRTRSAETKRH